MKEDKILVIIPAYNEEENIGAVIKDLRRERPDLDFLVVDDGSVDKTAEVAKKRGATVLKLPFNLGIGGAVQTGYKYALRYNYTVAVQMDGDGQHLPSEIEKIVSPIIKAEADVVIGSRFLQKSSFPLPFARRLGVFILGRVLSFLTHQKITDPTSGFRAVGQRVISYCAFEYPIDYPEPETVFLFYQKGYKIKEVPVRMRERRRGESSINLFRSGYYVVKILISLFIDLLG